MIKNDKREKNKVKTGQKLFQQQTNWTKTDKLDLKTGKLNQNRYTGLK